MEHRPFEDWLLNDQHLDAEDERKLRLHLRECDHCTALSRANLALRSAPVVAPASGFALRFQARLAAQRKIQRRRAILGSIVLVVAGIGLLMWLALPYIPLLSASPAETFATWLGVFLSLSTMLRAVGIISGTMLQVLVSFIPGYVWAAVTLFGTGSFSLWIISFRKFSHIQKTAMQAEGVKA